MADELSFLSGGDTVGSTPAPEVAPVLDAAPGPEATPAPEPALSEQPRAPDGKFAPKDTPAPAAVIPEPVPPAPAPPEPSQVPLAALHEERDRRQAAERQLAEFQAKAKPAEPVAPKPIPDVLDDPKGYQTAQDQKIAEQAFEIRRDFSWRFAVKEHGADAMATVKDWAGQKANSDPAFNLQLLQSDDLYETAVTAWKQEQLLSKVQGVDPATFDAFLAWQASQVGSQTAPPVIPQAIPLTAPAAASPTPPPTPPPASLAAIPSAGGIQPVSLDPGEAFEALFHR